MNIKKVEADGGLAWLAEGWRLFKLNPGMWIALVIVYLVIVFVLAIIPIIGALALMLITPALVSGLIYGARELDQGRDIEIGHLFVALNDPQKRVPMLTLGALYLGVMVLFAIVMFMFGGAAIMTPAMLSHGGAAAGGAGLTVILALLMGFATAMAFLFAGPLVLFQNLPPVDAAKASFTGCLQNIVPFLVYGVISTILAFIATLPFMLGWLVLGPVLVGATYSAYKGIFEGGESEEKTTDVVEKL